jgi:hypothetical protein
MKRGHFLTGGLVLFIGAVLAIGGVLWFSAGGASDEVSTREVSSSTPQAVTSPTPTAAASESATPFPGATLGTAGPAVVFLRDPTLSYTTPLGDLWITELNGSGARRLGPEAARSTFAGIVSTSDRPLLYYVAFGGDGQRALREADLSSGADREVFTFNGRYDFDGSASVSPDGSYVSFTDVDSVWLFNMQTQERTLLLQGNAPACEGGNAGKCFIYGTSQWSPDGRLLLVQKGFYEGAHFILANPFAEQPQILEFDQMSGAHISSWAPDGGAICMGGQYGGPTSLYLAQGPDWSAHQFFPEFEETGQTSAAFSAAGCAWPSVSRVGVLTWAIYPSPDGPSPAPELVLLNPGTPEAHLITSFPEGQGLNPALVGVPGRSQAVVQFWNGYSGEVGRSLLVDLETGEAKDLLGAGQWVVAVVP